jgi:hypothetical protein
MAKKKYSECIYLEQIHCYICVKKFKPKTTQQDRCDECEHVNLKRRTRGGKIPYNYCKICGEKYRVYAARGRVCEKHKDTQVTLLLKCVGCNKIKPVSLHKDKLLCSDCAFLTKLKTRLFF